MSSKPKILWCSQSPNIHTGYGVISRDILTRLHATQKYEIISQAWYDASSPNPSYPFESALSKNLPFKVVSTGAQNNEHNDLRHGSKNIAELIKVYKPDITVFFADIYMFQYILNVPELSQTHLLLYYPVDGVPLPPEWVAVLRKADTVISYNRFGDAIGKHLFPNNSHMIYHGIDYPFWSQPIPGFEIEAKKKQMFGTDDVFVWGMVARNNPRKNIPAFYETFAQHVKDHPKARMLMHACPVDFGWNLERLAMEYGIKDKIYLTPGLTPAKGVSPEELRLLYNTMDYHVNTAWGEGFGIPIVESMACGIPNLVTNYTVGPEFITENNAGELIEVGLFAVEQQTHVRRAYIDPRHLLQLMNKLYDDDYDKNKSKYDKLKRIYGRNAKTAASKFDWDKCIISQWETVLDKILANKKDYPIQGEII